MFERLNIKLLLPTVVIGIVFLLILLMIGDSIGTLALVAFLFVMVTCQAIASYVYSQQFLTKRLGRLKNYLDDVVSVDKAPQEKLYDRVRDDLGDILNELGDFIHSLSDVVSEIRQESVLLRDGSSQLSSQMEESVNAVDESTNQIELMANSIGEVAETSVVLSESADQVSETTSRVMEILAQGTSSSSTSQQIIESVADEVNGMANDLALLQEECSRIGSVLDVIRGIAEQTNLLALNAAIEAARAGEQGRGFAVVADEVRALAHRTQESTVEIQSMVEGLQEKSNNAVSAISRGQNLTQDSLTHSQEVVKALEQVGDVFAEVDNLTSQIASGTGEQQRSTNSINENMNTVVGLSREITSGLASVAEHAEQQRTTTAAVDTTLNRICV